MGLDAIIAQCAINTHPETVKAIIRVESNGNPLAIGVNYGGGRAPRPQTQAEAAQIARNLIEGGKNIDMGLMQINSANMRRLGLTPETIFDPCTNIRAGTQILSINYANAVQVHGQTETALKAALSTYNTGNMTRGLRNGYVARYYRNSQPTQATVASLGAVQSEPNNGGKDHNLNIESVVFVIQPPPNPYTADTLVYVRR